jgi:hypothetical protein
MITNDLPLQKHDLFLTDGPAGGGYLTGGSSSVAGYLTQGTVAKSSTIPHAPPHLYE